MPKVNKEKKHTHVSDQICLRAAVAVLVAYGREDLASVISATNPQPADVPTIEISSQTLNYNPEFIRSIGFTELVKVLAHEALHVTRDHTSRFYVCIDGFKEMFQRAADLEINTYLESTNIGAPQGIIPGKGEYASFPKHLTAEDYLPVLIKKDAAALEDNRIKPVPNGEQG